TRSESDRLEAMVDARTAEQRRLIAEIERNASQKRQLLADISHELRTPLTIIQGEAEVTLRRGEQPAEIYQDALARIRDSARHTNRIVDDLLLISRQEAAQLRLDRHEHDVRSILREAAETFPRDVALDLPEAPLHAYVDALRLRQCMLALFQNARRHGGPHIAASAREADGRLLLIVEDDGPGLSDGEKAQAFDRFFRGSGASGNEEGHGLGLPIVRSIVQAHDGTVDLADVETGGLRVIVDLPLRPTPRLVANRPEGPEPDPGIPDALNLRNKGGA
ncbi:sensor histidine kinase, partial [Jannaschia aquimarina]